MTLHFRRCLTLLTTFAATVLVASCARTIEPQVAPETIATLAKTYPLPMPPIVADLTSAKRSNVFYLNEPLAFTFDKPATRFEARDYRGNQVDKGALTASSTRFVVKAQPLGWYKLYLFGNRDQRQMYGKAIGGTTFCVFRKSNGFPALPAKSVSGGSHPSQDGPMRGVVGMGPQRFQADADNVEQTIKNLEQDIALDKKYYLPFDKTRGRVLLVAFGNGTKNLAGVRRIIERFKDDVQYWEPRNEPNFGAGGRDFVVNELKPFYETVKSVSPKLKVLGPGTVGINADMQPWLEDFFNAGGGKYIDAFSFHFYNGINGDVFLGRRALNTLMSLLKKHKLGNIEKWQTEQGNFAALYKVYQPAHQARWTMLQMMLFEQYGIPKEHNHLWYDRSHGFWGVPTWWVNDDGSLNPEAATIRVWSEELLGTRFHRVINFGASGNNLYLGAEFRSSDATKTVLSLMSVGDTKGKIEVSVTGDKTLRVVSPWGVSKDLPVKNNRVLVPVPELPIYIEVAKNQSVRVLPINYGNNLARAQNIDVVASARAEKADHALITNGRWENGSWDNQDHAWNVFNPSLPFTLDFAWAEPQTVSRMVIYAAPPWQPQSTLLDYEIQASIDDTWKTVAREQEPTREFLVWTPPTRTVIDIFHSDRWVFENKFAPVRTDKIRLVIHKVSNGGGIIPLVDQIKGGQAWNVPIVNLREVQIFSK